MNERIKLLANQAGAEVKIIHGDMLYISKADLDLEKFAELIVRECAGLVKGQPHFDKMLDCATVIKQHFGVEQ